MNREQIRREIDNYNSVIKEMNEKVAELEKQLAEPELLPCRFCGKSARYSQGHWIYALCSSGGYVCASVGPTRKTKEEAALAWNEMNDTRPARVIEKDGEKFIEFRALVKIGNILGYKKGTYWISESGNLFRDGSTIQYFINNSEDMKIEVK